MKATRPNVHYRDERGRTHTAHDYYPDRAVVITAGVRTRYLRDLRVSYGGFSFEYLPHFVLPPGGMLAIDVTPPSYWEQDQFEDGPVPSWAPAKLAQLEYNQVGPFTIAGYHDPNGNGPGGQGVAPYWFDYRNCAAGRRAASIELNGMANRTPIAYASPISSDRYSLAISAPPLGYEVNLKKAREWDPGCDEYLRFRRHDGQHLHRGYRAALALAALGDEWAQAFAELYLLHVQSAWGPKEITPTDTRGYWGVDQWLASEVCMEGCGRSWAHIARLVWTMTPRIAQNQFADSLEKMACQGGTPYFLNPQSHYATWAREKGGGKFGSDEPIAMSREWQLGEEAMSLCPGLAGLRRAMLAFHGTMPAKAMNATADWYGPLNHDYELFYNDLQVYGGSPEEVLRVSSTRHPESGSMPMDSWPQKFWQSHI